jgi:hypothetical protein
MISPAHPMVGYRTRGMIERVKAALFKVATQEREIGAG